MHIVVVEDDPINLAVLMGMAERALGCTVEGFSSPHEALSACVARDADLLIVDYQMPGMDGVELVQWLRLDRRFQNVPILMITADHHRDLRITAMEAGATDFLTKPVDPDELKLRVKNLLGIRQAQIDLAERADVLAAEAEAAALQLLPGHSEIIRALAREIDGGANAHVSRVADISRIIAEELGLDSQACRNIYLAAPLHDVGMLRVPDGIVNKRKNLSAAEATEMRRHAEHGAAIFSNGSCEAVRVAKVIARSHHENWDGTGYPAQLRGQEIPVEARIVAVADRFDTDCAFCSCEEVRAKIVAVSGTTFDPEIVGAFEAAWDRIAAVVGARPGTLAEVA